MSRCVKRSLTEEEVSHNLNILDSESRLGKEKTSAKVCETENGKSQSKNFFDLKMKNCLIIQKICINSARSSVKVGKR